VIATGVALVLAGCGSSSKPENASGHGSQFVVFAQCMRANGVPGFPDPSGSGGGIQIQAGSGINPASPAFEAAQSKCRKLLPGGGPGKGQSSEQVEQQMLAKSVCMRAHGVTGFPDPTTSAPRNLNPAQYSIAMGRAGVFLLVPRSIDVASPAFQHAAAACGFGPGGSGKVTAAP
jgi:hypothetical protein